MTTDSYTAKFEQYCYQSFEIESFEWNNSIVYNSDTCNMAKEEWRFHAKILTLSLEFPASLSTGCYVIFLPTLI